MMGLANARLADYWRISVVIQNTTLTKDMERKIK
jgi:hypothetical protein